MIVQIEGPAAQQAMGLAHLFVALHVLRTDIQQADGRALRAVDRRLEGLAHDGEFDQLGRITVDVGADVQHGGNAAQGRPAGDNGRPFQPRRGHTQL